MDVLLFQYLKLSVQDQYKEVLLQAATFLEGVTLLQDKWKGTNLINKSNAISELFSLECKDGNTAKFSTDANKAIRKYYQAKVTGEDMIMYVLTNAFRGPEYESFRMAHAAKIDQIDVDKVNLPDHIDHMVNTVNISKVGSRQKGAVRTIGGKGSAPKCPAGGKHHRGKCPNKG